jgi:hypothetical protein
MKRDITDLVRGADDLLRHTENPLHRRILENYRRHALLEVTGRWEEIFSPEMTVEHPVYFVNAGGTSATLDGFEQVAGFYRSLAGGGLNVIVLEDERIAVADWGFASESVFHTYTRGTAVPDADPEGFFVISQVVSMNWPYDARGRMIGEHVYEHADHMRVQEVPEAEFITAQEADEKLTPLLRPLTPFHPAATA